MDTYLLLLTFLSVACSPLLPLRSVFSFSLSFPPPPSLCLSYAILSTEVNQSLRAVGATTMANYTPDLVFNVTIVSGATCEQVSVAWGRESHL